MKLPLSLCALSFMCTHFPMETAPVDFTGKKPFNIKSPKRPETPKTRSPHWPHRGRTSITYQKLWYLLQHHKMTVSFLVHENRKKEKMKLSFIVDKDSKQSYRR